MKSATFSLLLVALGFLSVNAQQRLNVMLSDKTVQNFPLSEVDQIAFDNQSSVLVQTGDASSITTTGASVSARITSEDPTPEDFSYGILFGTTRHPQQQVPASGALQDGVYSVSLTNLTPATTYYYRPYAIQNGIIYYGDVSFFQTVEEKVNTDGVAFLSQYATPDDILQNGDDDEASVWLWFHQEYPQGPFLYAGNIHAASDLLPYRVLFYIRDLDAGSENDAWTQPSSIQQATPYIKEWYRNGGNMVLWQHAVTFITDLGRMDRDMMRNCDHRITIGKGSWNQGQWYMAVQLNPASRFIKDFSKHPLYNGLEIRSTGRSKFITVKGPAWTEDHNCVFHNLPAQLTGLGNQDPRCYEVLTDTYGIYPLAVWDSQIDWISQLNVWEARQGNTDFKGTILCVGNGGLEFSYKNADGTPDKSSFPRNSPFQSNVLKIAANAIGYLASGNLYDWSETTTASSSDYREKMRPQIHFTPAKNWINDPNGMVYADGIWHLYYQYNPSGPDWGNISWGHATSSDLFHWKEQPVALEPDNLGFVYSGSAVVDSSNTAGFGENAIIAMYTSHGDHEQQCIAYSTDGGMTFTKYEKNPVIKNTTHGDFRDPKVVWDDTSNAWYCILALGGEHSAQIYRSYNLKTWTLRSTFTALAYAPACNRGIWECADLFPIQYKGERKWVLTVNVSDGGPVVGSGTMYFVGNFSSGRFTPDRYSYPLWEDHGMDDYASVIWSNTGDRRVCIGWMNNQAYGGYPVSPWRCCMTLPREMVLEEYNGQPLLKTTIVKEIEGIAEPWQTLSAANSFIEKPSGELPDAYQLNVTVDMTADANLILANAIGQEYGIHIDAQHREIIINRGTKSGNTDFNANFAIPTMRSSLYSDKEKITLCVFVDQSNVEVTTEDGSVIMSTLVFPDTIYNRVSLSGSTEEGKVRLLRSVWR